MRGQCTVTRLHAARDHVPPSRPMKMNAGATKLMQRVTGADRRGRNICPVSQGAVPHGAFSSVSARAISSSRSASKAPTACIRTASQALPQLSTGYSMPMAR